MPLKMTLEPQEWLMIGGTKVVNIHPNQATFTMEGAGPVLRQAFTMAASEADTSAKRTYFAVQRLYLGLTSDMAEYQRAASELLRDVPTSQEVVVRANTQIANGSLYGALSQYRKLLGK
jgi:flagellar biosynthesis regulator FlbT